ncbi:hypothetical protein ACR6C2_20945 [Streptomyces sp. INA 01156]
MLLGPASARPVLTAAGVVAALLLCAAVTWATHAALTARALRGRLEEVSQDVGRLLQERARQAEEARRQHERLTGELAGNGPGCRPTWTRSGTASRSPWRRSANASTSSTPPPRPGRRRSTPPSGGGSRRNTPPNSPASPTPTPPNSPG